ncbi:NADH dehydrogenase [ubiquinone] iron-sulfur protein 4, mitochondrial [Eufriesea mexicana]|nr:NADH dehydrogenase [ubiquinone] iron-sulfur protein 4, mitochondrial [Eufriesea mexicana]
MLHTTVTYAYVMVFCIHLKLSRRFFASTGKESKQASALVLNKRIKFNVIKEKALAEEARKETVLIVSDNENVGICSGVPEEHLKTRTVRIYCPAKSAMQSGTNNINYWQIDFDTRERWENPLMGWTSTGDPLSNLQVAFATKEEATKYCDKMGWKYYIQKPNVNNPKPRSYGTNFSWNKRTRVSTK